MLELVCNACRGPFGIAITAILLIAGPTPASAQRPFSQLTYDEVLRRAEAGQTAVQIELGVRYEKGETIPADDRMAVYWYKQAADQGNAAGQFRLGLAYEAGLGVARDPHEALRLYRLAAEQGNSNAQTFLGLAYVDREGVNADPVEAYAWLSIATAQGIDHGGVIDSLKALMTAQEIREGQALAREYWEQFVLPARARAEAKAVSERKRIEEADAQQLENERLGSLDPKRMEYIAQIKDRIERNWLRPPGTAAELKCIVRVSQIPGGEVVQAEIMESSGNIAFDRSVEEAVLRSSPLPVPKDPSLFDRHIVITFEPEG